MNSQQLLQASKIGRIPNSQLAHILRRMKTNPKKLITAFKCVDTQDPAGAVKNPCAKLTPDSCLQMLESDPDKGRMTLFSKMCYFELGTFCVP